MIETTQRERPAEDGVGSGWLLNRFNMIIDRWISAYMQMVIHQRLIFCFVPKVACSNWLLTLRSASGLPELEDKNFIHDRELSGLHYLSQHKSIGRLLYLNNPAYTRAVFVRNPWTRALSAYRSKLESIERFSRSTRRHRFHFETIDAAKEFCRVNGMLETDGPELTFGEFLSFLEAAAPEKMNPHWQPQTIVAGLDKIRYHFMGRFETLERDAERLTGMLGLPKIRARRDSTATKSSEHEILARYYTPERLSQVGRIYARDIALLGYEPPQI